jgi:hypothetical protein
MIITINGKIKAVLPTRDGVSSTTGKAWVSQDFVIETENGDCICFNLFGEERIKNSGLKVGAIASVTCDVRSNESKGRWFTNIYCNNCIVQGAAQKQVPSAHTQAPVQPQPQHSSSSEVSANELPF